MTDNHPRPGAGLNAEIQDATAGSPALSQLLAAAAAPAHVDELAGSTAALAAFSRTIRPRVRTTSMISSIVAKLLAAKAATAAVGAVAVGGVALAAATGALPLPLQTSTPTAGAPVTATSSASSTDTPDATSSDTPDATTTAVASPTAIPTPNMVGLCRAYDAQVATAPGAALTNPAFTALITAAGTGGVPTYCATILAAAPGGRPTTLPNAAQSHRPAQATTHPSGAPGQATTHASSAPAPATTHATSGAGTTISRP